MELFICEGSNIKNKINILNSSNQVVIDQIHEIKCENEEELVKAAIKISNKDKYSIVLYSNLITLLKSTQITDYIEYICDNIDFDVFFLTRYFDKLTDHSDVSILDGDIEIMKVKSCHGIEGIIISPSGKEYLINKLETDLRGVDLIISNAGDLMNNYSTSPNLFSIKTKLDDSNKIIKHILYREAFNSAKPPKLTKKQSRTTTTSWFIFFILLFCCFLIFTIKGKSEVQNDIKLDENIQKINLN